MTINTIARGKRFGLALALAVCATSTVAHADMIEMSGGIAGSSEGLGSFTGSLAYDFDISLNEWALIITLKNTSEPSNGGYITGVIFNIGSTDSSASATLASTSHASFVNASNQNGAPFGGPFDAGAAIGGNWLGSGNPSSGVAVGQIGVFKFKVNASDTAFLTASSFISGTMDYDLLVRFRGFEDGGSDKVPATQIPGPSALAAMAMFLALPIRRRRNG